MRNKNTGAKWAKLIFLLCFLFPLSSYAGVEITEIMYDLEGGDSGREWVEIYNNGSSSVDLSSYIFFEADTNHSLTPSGSSLLPANTYAVISDNVSTFSSDNPSFTGLLFDSSFSLSNSGELLEIRDGTGVTIDSVTYTSLWGASGNGMSLTKNSGVWAEASPSPGSGISSGGGSSESAEEQGLQEGGSSRSGPPYSSPTDNIHVYVPAKDKEDKKEVEFREPGLFVEIDAPQKVIAGAPVLFKAHVLDEWGKVVKGVHNGWNFGDGFTGEGVFVEHSFLYPGSYIVVLQSWQLGMEAINEFYIEVVPADIYISDIKGSMVEIVNGTSLNIDLSEWMVVSDAQVSIFPDFSTLKSNSRATFATNIPLFGKAELVFPSGTPLSFFEKESVLIHKTQDYKPVATDSVVYTEVAQKEIKKDFLLESQNLLASVLNSKVETEVEDKEGQKSVWLLALFGVIVLGIAGSIAIRRGVYEGDYYE